MNREIAACATCATYFFILALKSGGTFEAFTALLAAALIYASFWETLWAAGAPAGKGETG